MVRLRVAAALIERDGSVLLGKRPKDKRYAGLWEMPGGKALYGETTAEALGREILEELGVEIASVGSVMFSVDDPGSSFVIEFCRVVIMGEPVAIEHESLAWVEYSKLLTYSLAPGDREFCKWLLAGAAWDSMRGDDDETNLG